MTTPDTLPASRRLPTEIFMRIFAYLPKDRPNAQDRSLIAITHICHQWRAVAFGCQELWTQASFHYGLEWTKRALELSGSLPLSVRLDRSSKVLLLKLSFYEEARLVLSQLPRIRRLVLSIDDISEEWLQQGAWRAHSEGRAEIMDRLAKKPAPLLKELQLDFHAVLNAKQIPPSIFQNVTPCLQTLTLRDVNVLPHHQLFLTPLTSLSVTSCNIWKTIDEFLDSLQRLPMLKTFDFHARISDNHINFDIPTACTFHSIRMPHLKVVFLLVDLLSAVTMLRYLSIPTEALLQLYCLSHPQDLVDVVPILEDAVSAQLHDAFRDGFAFRLVRVMNHKDPNDEVGLTIVGANPGPLDGQISQSTTPSLPKGFRLTVYNYGYPNWALYIRILTALTSLPALNKPKALIVRHDLIFSIDDHWRDILCSFEQVRRLEIEGLAAYGYIQVLSKIPGSSFLPRDVLSMKNVNFNSPDGCLVIDWLTVSLVCLQVRGCKLPSQILIRKCDISRDKIARLRCALVSVNEIVWDGVEDGVEDGTVREG